MIPWRAFHLRTFSKIPANIFFVVQVFWNVEKYLATKNLFVECQAAGVF